MYDSPSVKDVCSSPFPKVIPFALVFPTCLKGRNSTRQVHIRSMNRLIYLVSRISVKYFRYLGNYGASTTAQRNVSLFCIR